MNTSVKQSQERCTNPKNPVLSSIEDDSEYDKYSSLSNFRNITTQINTPNRDQFQFLTVEATIENNQYFDEHQKPITNDSPNLTPNKNFTFSESIENKNLAPVAKQSFTNVNIEDIIDKCDENEEISYFLAPEPVHRNNGNQAMKPKNKSYKKVTCKKIGMILFYFISILNLIVCLFNEFYLKFTAYNLYYTILILYSLVSFMQMWILLIYNEGFYHFFKRWVYFLVLIYLIIFAIWIQIIVVYVILKYVDL